MARRIVVGVIGASVVLFGVLLIFLPGPAFVVIPLGLAILSLEFAWARKWLHKLRQKISEQSIARVGRRARERRPPP